MAVILSIETATEACSVALHSEDNLLSYIELQIEKSHSEKLTTLIESVVKLSNMDYKDIDAIAVSKGPGSYTGLRVGTSTAKGLAMSLDKPIIAIPTLKSMALEVTEFVREDVLLCPMIDARRMEVYCALFDKRLDMVEEINAKVLDENSFSEYFNSGRVIFFGDGSEKFSKIAKDKNATFIHNLFPKAKNIGELAWISYKEKRFENLASFEPFYLKDFVLNKKN